MANGFSNAIFYGRFFYNLFFFLSKWNSLNLRNKCDSDSTQYTHCAHTHTRHWWRLLLLLLWLRLRLWLASLFSHTPRGILNKRCDCVWWMYFIMRPLLYCFWLSHVHENVKMEVNLKLSLHSYYARREMTKLRYGKFDAVCIWTNEHMNWKWNKWK